MDKQKKAEYDKLLAKLNVQRLSALKDPVATWAVTELRRQSQSKADTEKRNTANEVGHSIEQSALDEFGLPAATYVG
jgi:hypothetical protein